MSAQQKPPLGSDVAFLRDVIKAQSRLLLAYRLKRPPPEWVHETIARAQKAGIEC